MLQCVLSDFIYIHIYWNLRIIAVLPVDSIVVKPQTYIVHVILSHNQKPHPGLFKVVVQNLKCKINGAYPQNIAIGELEPH